MYRSNRASDKARPRNPFARHEVFEPTIDGITLLVDPRNRIILENRAAKPGANVIQII